MLNLAFLQYYFSQGEHTLKYAPHGNAHSGEPYIRTMPSTLCKVKEKAKETTAKRALKYLSNEAGGILEATSASSLPRGRQQVNDARRKGVSKQTHDPLYAVMYMCKEAEGQKCKDSFVRTVNAAPFPMMVLAFDYTLDDLVRFCTGEKYCVFGVDPTFNRPSLKPGLDWTGPDWKLFLMRLSELKGLHAFLLQHPLPAMRIANNTGWVRFHNSALQEASAYLSY